MDRPAPPLADDCFAAGEATLTLAEAEALLAERVGPVAGMERVPLAEAAGRVLAEDLRAGRDVPPHDNAAVDGYALRHADLRADGVTRLPLGGRAAAGHPLGRALAPGEAIRIFTGAPLPPGADCVAMQEDCVAEAGHVLVPPGLKAGANRRFAGEDLAAGSLALTAGRRLRPVDLGLAASLGLTHLTVRRPLTAALFSTGDEVVEPGRPLPPGRLYDANRYALAALLRAQGVVVTDLGILPDSAEAIGAALAAAAPAHDLLVTSGGVSEGDEDHLQGVLARLGRRHLWRLAIKPGRPVTLGRIGAASFIGLPGNPAAAVVTFVALARPLLQRLAGETPRPPLTLPAEATFAHSKKPGRQEWLRVSLRRAEDGRWLADRFPRAGSGVLSSLSATDGLAPLAEATSELRPGEILRVIPYSEVLA